MQHAGELAALATAACWTVSALSFEIAGKRIGTLSLNIVRLVMAFAFLAVFGAVTRGMWLPTDASTHALVWLSTSALVGFVFGDLCLFRAFVMVGPRLSTLVMSLAPLLTAVFGFAFLGESLGVVELLGMSLTVAGIAWAVHEGRRHLEPRADESEPSTTAWTRGILFAFGGALGQAGGLVLSKYGMGDYDPFAATQVRVMAGVVGFAAVCTVARWWPRVVVAVRDSVAMKWAAVGSAFGPFIGVSLSLLAVQLAPAGVAASIISITPVLLVPIAFLRGEKVGLGGAIGALLAVAGVALLFL